MARAQIASGDLCFALARLRGGQVSPNLCVSAAPRESFHLEEEMFGVDDLVNSAIKLGTDVIDRVFPDPAQAAQAKIELFKLQQQGELARLAADTDIVKKGQDIILAEANSQSWLTKNWRPSP